MGMEVMGNLAHLTIQTPIPRPKALVSSRPQHRNHVLQIVFGWLSNMTRANDHRHRANLAIGYPADIVLEIPVSETRCLAEIAAIPTLS